MRSLIRGLLVTTGLLFISNPSFAQNQTTLRFDSPAQPLADALRAFGSQANLNLMFDTLLVAGRTAPAIRADLTPQQMLDALLKGTGIRHEFVNETTVILTPTKPARQSEQIQEHQRVAEAMQEVQRTAAGARVEGAQTAPATDVEDNKGIPEILVKGRRTLNTDIRRTENEAQPYVVFDSEQIRQSQASSLEDFFRTRLPMNTVQTATSQTAGASLGSLSAVDLRGLGTNNTLILMDGRRMPSINNGGSFNQADINGIPLGSIERIEILPATASGIYGGGATGGVINIITRKDYSGAEIGAAYGNTFRSDAGSYRIDASGGFSFEGGRTNVVVAGSHSASDVLLVQDRNFTQRSRDKLRVNNPAAIFGTGVTPLLGYTTNIRNAGANQNTNLVLKPAYGGGALSAPYTYIPAGYSGHGAGTAAALAANAGQYNFDLADSLSGDGGRQSLLNGPTLTSATMSVRRSFSENIDAFIDGSWLRNRGEGASAQGLGNTIFTLPAASANNPFTTDVSVRYPAIGFDLPLISDSQIVRTVGGLIARLPHQWTAGVDYVWSRSRLDQNKTTDVFRNTLGAALSSGSIDVMRDVNAFPVDWSSYLLPSPNDRSISTTLLQDATLRVSGLVLSLPAGPLTAAAFVEWREERTEDIFRQRINTAGVGSVSYTPGSKQQVYSYYLETRVPLISEAMAKPLLQGLELQLSVRSDEYSTRSPTPRIATLPSMESPRPALTYLENESSATKYTAALLYEPVAGLKLRTSYGTGFLAPSIIELVPNNAFPVSGSVVDPKRGAVTGPASYQYFTGGNPNVQPEESKSWSVGLIFSPGALPDFRLSLDYTLIEKSDEIEAIGISRLLALEDILPGRIVRNALTPADAALGYTGGTITQIYDTVTNIGATEVEAYDLQADYTLRTGAFGDFHFYGIATWQPHFKVQITPDAPVFDSVGYSGGRLEWRGNGGIEWTRGPWMVGWNAQYYNSYLVYPAESAPATITSFVTSQGTDRITDQIYHDLIARYRFENLGFTSDLFDGMEMSLGIQNIFDKSPPIIVGQSQTYSTYGDPRLRRFMLTLKKDF